MVVSPAFPSTQRQRQEALKFRVRPGIQKEFKPAWVSRNQARPTNKRQIVPKLVYLYIKMHLLFFLKFLLKLLYFKLWQPYLTDVHTTDQNAWPQVHASDQNCLATGACIWSKYLAINECMRCSKCQTRGWKFTASWYYRRLLSSVQRLGNSSEYPLVCFKL